MRTKNIITKIICIALAFVLCGCAANTATPSATVPPAPQVTDTKYDDLSNGLGTFVSNATMYGDYIRQLLASSPYAVTLEGEQKEYFESTTLLLAMFELEASLLWEINALAANGDYPDRADGKLAVSGYQGCKILQNSRIKFDCNDPEGTYTLNGELLWGKDFMEWTSTEEIVDDVTATVRAEIVIKDNGGYVMRYSNSTLGDNGEEYMSSVVVICTESMVEVAYFEGEAKADDYIDLELLVDHNLKALTFGVGTVISFEFEL